MKVFILYREEDVSGVSGIGVVAEGIEFDNGKCAVSWRSQYGSVKIFDSISIIEKIHGHGGKTKIMILKDINYDEEGKLKEIKSDN